MIPCDYCGKPDQAPDEYREATIMCDECWQKKRDKFMADIVSHIKSRSSDD